MDYRYVLDVDVAEVLLSLPLRQRRYFITISRRLAEDPSQTGEETFLDDSERVVQKKQFGQWRVSYWADHATKEMRIVGIQRSKA